MSATATVPVPSTGITRRLMSNGLGVASAVVIILVVLIAALAPVLPMPSPDAGNLSEAMQGPSAAHWLGTDTTGRDILSRLIWGARINLLGAALAVVVALVLGVPVGIDRKSVV